MGREEQPHLSALFECARSPEISQRFPLWNSFSNSHPPRTVVLPWPGSVMVPGCDEEGAGTLPTRLKDPTKLRPRGRRVHPSQWVSQGSSHEILLLLITSIAKIGNNERHLGRSHPL